MTGSAISRTMAFVRSTALLALVVVGVPWVLAAAARARFGGPSPFHGVPGPADWDVDRIRRSLTDRLTDDTIADVVIRSCLVVAWLAVVVLVLTIAVEVAHLIRHAGMPMPDVRGLAPAQRVARVIAVGLLALTPMLASPSRGIARDGGALVPPPGVEVLRPDAAGAARPTNVWTPGTPLPAPAAGVVAGAPPATAPVATTPAVPAAPAAPSPPAPAPVPQSASVHVVQPGDSIYAIARRRVGPDPRAVVDYAERMIELNLGHRMVDGRRFTNAALIDVGWELRLPDGEVPTTEVESPGAGVEHVVAPGESLWSIAAAELGDAERWREIHELNRGRVFGDGGALSDPDLIRPGWRLRLPTATAPGADVADIADAADVQDVEVSGAEVAGAEVAGAEVAGADLPAAVITGSEVADAGVADAGAAGADVPAPAVAAEAASDGDVGEGPEATSTEPSARPANVWSAGQRSSLAPPASGSRPAADRPPPAIGTPSGGSEAARPVDHATGSPAPTEPGERVPAGLLSLGGAAALATGVLTLLAVRRRQQLRRARPRTRLPMPEPAAAAIERTLRGIDGGDRMIRVDVAVRSAAPVLARAGARVLFVLVSHDGEIELRALGPVVLPAPWVSDGDPVRWTLPAAVPNELVAADSRGAVPPCPTLVQIGRTPDGRDLLADLEALEAIEVGGPADQAEAIVRAIATSLSSSVLAEVTTLVAVGVADGAFLDHRHHVAARDAGRAFELATEAIGSTGSADRSTFELRVAASAGETWEPAVVLAGASAGTISPPQRRTGLAVVSASPIHGPSSRLAPAGDTWELQPAGIRVIPLGLSDQEVADLSALVGVADLGDPSSLDVIDPDITIVDRTDDVRRPANVDVGDEPDPRPDVVAAVPDAPRDRPPDGPVGAIAPRTGPDEPDGPATDDPALRPSLDWRLLVRLFGGVQVVAADGTPVDFERSKAKELVAWLATHRERATRVAARTALWEHDVRDGTFANVVSEARRSLARLVEPPVGDEWVGRTMTEALPLHLLVRTDAELVEHALAVARVQPPDQAIATLGPAVEWIHGMPFEGTTYLWPDAEGITSHLVVLATSATAELAAHHLSIGDVDGVFRSTARGLQVLPAHETLIGLRMQAHARAGDLAGVRHEWESYERVIVADPWSDGEPAPKLVELRRRLLHPSR